MKDFCNAKSQTAEKFQETFIKNGHQDTTAIYGSHIGCKMNTYKGEVMSLLFK